MLPKASRLSPREAKEVKKKISSKFFSLYYHKKTGPNPRFMVIVGSKVHSSAVRRNLLKRQIRETLRLVEKPVDAVVAALPAAKNLDKGDIKKEINQLLNKI